MGYGVLGNSTVLDQVSNRMHWLLGNCTDPKRTQKSARAGVGETRTGVWGATSGDPAGNAYRGR